MTAPAPQTGITREDLLALVEILRTPPPTEKEKRELAEQQQMREQSVEQIKEQEAAREWTQTKGCKHRRRDNSPRTVAVNNHIKSGGTFQICQACQVVIRPEDEKGKRYENGTIFDTHLYNDLLVDQSPVIW